MSTWGNGNMGQWAHGTMETLGNWHLGNLAQEKMGALGNWRMKQRVVEPQAHGAMSTLGDVLTGPCACGVLGMENCDWA